MKKSLNAWTVDGSLGMEAMFEAVSRAGFDGIELNVDVSPRVILLGGRAAVVKGCVVLAADCRNADIDTKVTPVISSCVPGGRDFPCRLSCDVTFAGGEKLRMTDYASAGADWERPDRFITAWLDLK